MVRIMDKETRSYQDGEFYVDIVFYGDLFEAYIVHKDCCTKQYMFGIPVEQADGTRYDWEMMELVVDANLEEYEEAYREDIMEG